MVNVTKKESTYTTASPAELEDIELNSAMLDKSNIVLPPEAVQDGAKKTVENSETYDRLLALERMMLRGIQ